MERIKILIVDDDRTMRVVLGRLLAELGELDLIEGPDGAGAWKKIAEGLRPDLCLIDIVMPGMDGMELVQRIRFNDATRNLKIIICSSAKGRQSVAAASALDVSGYVTKPFSAKGLLAEVRRVLGMPLTPPNEAGKASLP